MSDTRTMLLRAAAAARQNAYAPYSRFSVGAALITDRGTVFTGCNVENASYGLTCCAERNAIFAMAAAGERRIAEIAVVGDTAEFLPPCGACRQVIAEFGDSATLIHLVDNSGRCTTLGLDELMPYRFHLLEEKK